MRRIAYIVSDGLVKASSQLPSNKHRSAVVHSLVRSFGLLSGDSSNQLYILRPPCASEKQLLAYHEQEYVDYVLRGNPIDDRLSVVDDLRPRDLGLEDDCPPFPGLSEYVQQVAGASLAGAAVLRREHADVSINWDGGRHHAQKSCAAGFCYIADCVLAILALKRPPRSRIMYLDLDLHFSDAVSQAFAGSTSGQVLTMSIHHSAPGFFPHSPLSSIPDPQTHDPYTLSLPLKRGASDKTFHRIWRCVEAVKHAFRPDFLIVQCGADGLAGDPCATWNWSLGSSEGSFGWCISKILEWECKTQLLGGGGYHSPNAARVWCYITSVAVSAADRSSEHLRAHQNLSSELNSKLGRPLPLDADIPDHSGFSSYGPSFTLDVPAGNMRDENTDEYLQEIERVYSQIVDRLRMG